MKLFTQIGLETVCWGSNPAKPAWDLNPHVWDLTAPPAPASHSQSKPCPGLEPMWRHKICPGWIFIGWVISDANEWEDNSNYFWGRGGGFQSLSHCPLLGF